MACFPAVVTMSEMAESRTDFECNWVAVAIAAAMVVFVTVVALDSADMGLVVVASFVPFSTLHYVLSIERVHVVQRTPLI